MVPKGPYRYRPFNMLPVRRTPVDRGAQRRREGSGDINVVFWMWRRRFVAGGSLWQMACKGPSASEGVSWSFTEHHPPSHHHHHSQSVEIKAQR